MSFAARGVERLPGDVAATVSADLPTPPRHRPAVAVFGKLLHIPLGNADYLYVVNRFLSLRLAVSQP